MTTGGIVGGLALVVLAGLLNGSWNAAFRPEFGLAVRKQKAGQDKTADSGHDDDPSSVIVDLDYHLAWVLFQVYASIVNTIVCIVWAGGMERVSFIVKEAPAIDIVLVILFSVLWGIGSVGFGIACRVAGVGLGTNLLMGLIMIIGAFLPLVLDGVLVSATGAVIVSGILVCCIGLGFVVKSLQLRDKDEEESMVAKQSVEETEECHMKKEDPSPSLSTTKKVFICAIAALFASMLQFAFVFGSDIVDITESQNGPGSTPSSGVASVIWLFAIPMGAPASIIYGLYMNPSSIPWSTVYRCPWYRHILIILTTSLPWVAHIHLYGVSTTLLPDDVGPGVAWPVLMMVTVLAGLVWSICLGEWANSSKATRTQLRIGGVFMLCGISLMMASIGVP